jgi:hypothetical protein
MKRFERFRIAERLEARCVLSAADAFDFGGAEGAAAFSRREDGEIGPALISTMAPLPIEMQRSIAAAPPAPLSITAVDAVLSQPSESGIMTTVTATMTRSNDAFDRRDLGPNLIGGPAGSSLGASSIDRSTFSSVATPSATPPTWAVTLSVTFGPMLPQGWSSAMQNVIEHLAPTTLVFQFTNATPVPESSNGRSSAPIRMIGRISPPDFALMMAAAVRAQTAWAAAYLSEAASQTEPASPNDGADTTKKVGNIQRASDESQANATTNSTRSQNGAEEGGYIEFALLSSSDAKAAAGKNVEESLDVLPEGDALLPWEIDEEAIDELLAAGMDDQEDGGETESNSHEDTARMAFSANEGGLVSLDGTVFPEIDPAQYVDASNDARNVATAEPVEVRMDGVLRLFQAFEVTTDVLRSDADSPVELISVPAETLPAEAVPVDAVAPKPQESGPGGDPQAAAAALVVGMVSVGATLGRRSRERDAGHDSTGDTERVS